MIFRAMERTGVEDVRQVMKVGDTPLDLQAGTNAGVRGVVGVLTGVYGRERLNREPNTHIIPSVKDLPELIEREFCSYAVRSPKWAFSSSTSSSTLDRRCARCT